MTIPDCKSRTLRKPAALRPGAKIAVVAPSSPADARRVARGYEELVRLGYAPRPGSGAMSPEAFFAGGADRRTFEVQSALSDTQVTAVFCTRGGYGASEVAERLAYDKLGVTRIFLGHSDVTALQSLLWQKLGWVTFYGPMVAAGFDAGAAGYDESSFRSALCQTQRNWDADLNGAPLVEGKTEGRLLGGCLTLIEDTLGTPWELDTRGAILLLEDRGMKPFQVDRALLHLRQAGKLRDVRGVVLGEFPECDAPAGNDITVRDVCERVLSDLGIPVVFGAPIGHTSRPMLTLPLGVMAWLEADGPGKLIVEPAVE